MKVTLDTILRSKKWDETNALELKHELLHYKKKGKLFFMEDMSSIGVNEEFELYYFQLPNEQTSVNAFPVPKEEFRCGQSDEKLFEYLKSFFEMYYPNTLFDEKWFEQYKQQPYVGAEYVWYYQDSLTS
jgi:hypothetical protein